MDLDVLRPRSADRMTAYDMSEGSLPEAIRMPSRASRASVMKKEREEWSDLRLRVARLLESSPFEGFICAVILANCILILLDTDKQARCHGVETQVAGQCSSQELKMLSNILLAFYTMEVLVRFYAYRFYLFTSRWNNLDLMIVCFGYVSLIVEALKLDALPGFQMFRIFRLVRLLRAARFVRIFPELHSIIRGFSSAMTTMAWGFLALLALLMMWAIIAVEIINPINVEVLHPVDRCRTAYSSVFNAVVLMFETLVAGDAWGECAVPIIDHAPASFFVFASMCVCIQLGFTNLILSVIVERAAEAQRLDVQQQVMDQQRRRREAEARLDDVCVALDTDEDGVLTLEEVLAGFDTNDDFKQALSVLDIDRTDLANLFHLMDADGDGVLSYKELVHYIHRADSHDMRRQMMYIKLQVEDTRKRVKDHMDVLVGPMLSLMKRLEEHMDSKVNKSGSLDIGSQAASCHPSSVFDTQFPSLAGTATALSEEFARCQQDLKRELTALEHQVACRERLLENQLAAAANVPWQGESHGKQSDAAVCLYGSDGSFNGSTTIETCAGQWDVPQQKWGIESGVQDAEENHRTPLTGVRSTAHAHAIREGHRNVPSGPLDLGFEGRI